VTRRAGRSIFTALALACACAPLGARAHDDTPPPLPPEQRPIVLRGEIAAARPFYAQLLTADGRYINLNLRRGTAINPTGTKLAIGMMVRALGVRRRDGSLDVSAIDVAPGSVPALRR
jgi:hypothetical protein